MKQTKRAIALLAVAALLITGLPAAAFAEETPAESTETVQTQDAQDTQETPEEAVTYDMSKAEIDDIGEVTYNGSAFTPEVKVTYDGKTLTAGSDYEVSYSDNTNAGLATVTVSGMGSYTGTKTKTFRIRKATQTIEGDAFFSRIYEKDFKFSLKQSAKTKISYTTSDKKIATVSKKGKVTIKGYGTVIIKATARKTKNYKKSPTKEIKIVIRPKKVKWKYAKSHTVKGAKIGWKQDKTIDGYQVQISKSKSFNSLSLNTYPNKNKVGLSWTGFLKDKTYYFRIRSYKKVGNTRYFSRWSSTKAVKIRAR